MRLTSNTSLIIISFLCAVGLMWVKGQERLIRKVIQDVRITVENYPENMVLPDPWIPPTTTCAISGPRNIVEFLYSDQCSFRIDVSKYNLPEGDTGLPVN